MHAHLLTCRSCHILCMTHVDIQTYLIDYVDAGKNQRHSQAQSLHGHHVSVFPRMLDVPPGLPTTYGRSHLFVAESAIQGAGSGVFTVTGLRKAPQDQICSRDRPDDPGHPVLSLSVVTAYTGAVYKTGEVLEEGDRLAVLTREDGTRINPEEGKYFILLLSTLSYSPLPQLEGHMMRRPRSPTHTLAGGGVAVRFNMAHGTKASMAIMTPPPAFNSKYDYLVAIKDVKPGEELTWDYDCVTNEHRDKLLKVKCACGGLECQGRVFGKVKQVRACTGALIEFEPKQKMRGRK